MVEIAIHLVVGDSALRNALRSRISRQAGFEVAAQDGRLNNVASGDLVLTTPSDCSPAQCGELVRDGVQVVLLAPVPRETDRANYAFAGARYIPMLVNTGELFDVLLEAARTLGPRVPGRG